MQDGILNPMPNQPKTPNRTIRVSDERWEAFRACAEHNGESMTDAICAAIDRYVARTRKKMDSKP